MRDLDSGNCFTLKEVEISKANSRRRLLKVAAISALAFGCSSDQKNIYKDNKNTYWNNLAIPSQKDRTVIITGGNGYPVNEISGLGYHDALALAYAGANVIIASRNLKQGDEAVLRIKKVVPNAKIRFETLDLADLRSIRNFCHKMTNTDQKLDALINNAGVMGRTERETSVDGFERVFATNTLGHFVLTTELLPLLKRGHNPKVIWVSSLRAANAKLNFDDLQLERNYDYAAAYDQSKLANLLLAKEFNRRSRNYDWGVSSISAHPGVARTNLIPHGPGLDSREGRRFRAMPFLFQPAAFGALSTLHAATARDALADEYYGPDGILELRGMPTRVEIPNNAQNSHNARKLWEVLETMRQVADT